MGEPKSETFIDRLKPILAQGDLVAAHELLTGLEGDELREAKQWFDAHARWFREMGLELAFVGADHDERSGVSSNADWIVGMCAVVLCGPRTAANRVPWLQFWNSMEHDGEAAFVQLLWDQTPHWVEEFVDAASQIRLGSRARKVNASLSRVVRAATVHHRLPCPAGATFLTEWLAGTPAMGRWGRSETNLGEWLAVDPLMPDLLLHYLASGECSATSGLPPVVATLVKGGSIERAAVVDVVLVQLTAGQRPKSQRVLAQILGALDVSPAEIRGGLDYLLGVLSAGDRGVQTVLLPLALELAESSEDWHALAVLISGRPEKKAKVLLFASLKSAALSGQVATDVAAAVLDLLDTGDDAALTGKIDALRAELGLAAGDQTAPAAIGLWSTQPTPNEPHRTGPIQLGYHHAPIGWGSALVSAPDPSWREKTRPLLVDQALVQMVDGSYDGSAIISAAQELLDMQRLLGAAVASAFDELFLSGGLRQGWPTAVAVADLAALSPKRPVGLAEIVRLLVRYAHEVPLPQQLPAGLAALAAETGRNKAVMEARKLVTALAGTDDDTAVAAEATAPVHQGLWQRMVDETEPLPSQVPITDDPITARASTLAGLRYLLSEEYNGWAQSCEGFSWMTPSYGNQSSLTGLTGPDRVLTATVNAIHRHGADATRAALRGIERHYQPIDVVVAIDAWVDGGLDAQTFWRLASGPVVSTSELLGKRKEQGVPVANPHEWLESMPSFGARLRLPDDPEVAGLLVPRELEAPIERFAFLRAAEALLRAEHEPVVLSTPTWFDGTIGVEDLLARLRRVAQGSGVVGPIDLVQALHRLRATDNAWIGQVPLGLRTDPTFTDPAGREEWDATELVTRWLSAGGLPRLDPAPKEGRWTCARVTPVPFNTLAAWPVELADDPWTPGPPWPTRRLHPRWADRVVEEAFGSLYWFSPMHLPSLAPEPLGVPFHDRLLALVTAAANSNLFQASPTLVQLARWGRLDPAAVAVAAAGRHEAGTLSLALLVRTLQRELDTSLRGLWPMTLAIGDALCTTEKRSPQLADLLRLLAAYAHEVPASAVPEIPAGLQHLAASKGKTRAHEAARQLVDALNRAAS